jgi:hypothetical protein
LRSTALFASIQPADEVFGTHNPRHRLFRQETPGEWQGVFQRIAQAVRERVERP